MSCHVPIIRKKGRKKCGSIGMLQNPGNLVDIPRMNKNFGVGISWDVHKRPKVQANLVRKPKKYWAKQEQVDCVIPMKEIEGDTQERPVTEFFSVVLRTSISPRSRSEVRATTPKPQSDVLPVEPKYKSHIIPIGSGYQVVPPSYNPVCTCLYTPSTSINYGIRYQPQLNIVDHCKPRR